MDKAIDRTLDQDLCNDQLNNLTDYEAKYGITFPGTEYELTYDIPKEEKMEYKKLNKRYESLKNSLAKLGTIKCCNEQSGKVLRDYEHYVEYNGEKYKLSPEDESEIRNLKSFVKDDISYNDGEIYINDNKLMPYEHKNGKGKRPVLVEKGEVSSGIRKGQNIDIQKELSTNEYKQNLDNIENWITNEKKVITAFKNKKKFKI